MAEFYIAVMPQHYSNETRGGNIPINKEKFEIAFEL